MKMIGLSWWSLSVFIFGCVCDGNGGGEGEKEREETYEDMFKYSISPEKKVYYWVAIKLLTFKKRNNATVDIGFR